MPACKEILKINVGSEGITEIAEVPLSATLSVIDLVKCKVTVK
jgi:hypothetical protein